MLIDNAELAKNETPVTTHLADILSILTENQIEKQSSTRTKARNSINRKQFINFYIL